MDWEAGFLELGGVQNRAYVDDGLNKPRSRIAAAPPCSSVWIPPPEDHSKIHVDAAIPRAGGYGAVGAVCHDFSGISEGASVVVFRKH